jgi:hypothetical protein
MNTPVDTTPPADMPTDMPAMPAHQEIGASADLIDKSLSWLRFPPQLERQFLHDAAPQRLRYFMLSGVLSLLVFNGFLLADYLMAPDVFWVAVTVRLGLFTPVAIGVLLLPWLCSGWILRTVPPLVVEAVVLLSGVVAAASLAYILSISKAPTSQYYHVGLMVVLMYGNLVQRLRF